MTVFFQESLAWLTPVFVITSMLNVGLTQKPQRLLEHLKQWRFLVRMLLTNFVAVPAVMYFAVSITGVSGPYAIALMIFAMAAGAPLLIKLTAKSEHDISAGATVLMVLMAATIGYLPLMLPLVLDGVTVDGWAIAKPLVFQMLGPLVAGMIVDGVAEKFSGVIQPWIARISNVSLYAMLIFTVLGYVGELGDAQMWGALLVGMVVLLFAFLAGHGIGDASDTMSDIGGLGTAQRNTAAAVITAQTSFAQFPEVFLTVTLLNTLMMFVLLFIATSLGKGHRFSLLEPLAADPPRGSPEHARRSSGG